MSWNARLQAWKVLSLLPCQALTLSAQRSDPDGGETLLEIHQIQWFWRRDSHSVCSPHKNRIPCHGVIWIFSPTSTTFWNKPRMLRFSNFNQDSDSCEHVLPLHSALKHRAPYIATLAAWKNIKSRYEQKKHQHHLPSLTTNKQKMATLQGTTVARTFIFKSRKGLPSTSQGKWHSWIVHTQPLRPCDLAIN